VSIGDQRVESDKAASSLTPDVPYPRHTCPLSHSALPVSFCFLQGQHALRQVQVDPAAIGVISLQISNTT
jgi:hypothetical protein